MTISLYMVLYYNIYIIYIPDVSVRQAKTTMFNIYGQEHTGGRVAFTFKRMLRVEVTLPV